MKSKYTLPILAAMTGTPLPLLGTSSENAWGPPSQKPPELRDAEDLRRLAKAQERRERKAKR